MIIWDEMCLCDKIPSYMNSAQSAACELKSLHYSFTSSYLMAQARPGEVFIPNPVHNLMAFESVPLPPGWQVVHLDLIESIYILHKWKAHGGLNHLVLISYWVGSTPLYGVRPVPAGDTYISVKRSEEEEM